MIWGYLRTKRISNIQLYICETYVMRMWSVCAAYMQRMCRHMWTLCETYANYMWKINVLCDWVALFLCVCLQFYDVFFSEENSDLISCKTRNVRPYFSIVRKEKRTWNINKTRTIISMQKHFVSFWYVYVCACACACLFYVMRQCQQQKKTLS